MMTRVVALVALCSTTALAGKPKAREAIAAAKAFAKAASGQKPDLAALSKVTAPSLRVGGWSTDRDDAKVCDDTFANPDKLAAAADCIHKVGASFAKLEVATKHRLAECGPDIPCDELAKLATSNTMVAYQEDGEGMSTIVYMAIGLDGKAAKVTAVFTEAVYR
jgi:hypothetical protein